MKMILMTLLHVLIIAVPMHAQDTLVLSRMDSPLAEIGQNILHEAYQRVGIQIDVQLLPAERALYMANYGDVDGLVLRIKEIETRYPNLRRVPVTVIALEGVVFTKNITFDVMGWESLTPYQIGILRGSKFAEIGTQGMMVEMATTYEQVLLKLNLGRSDVVVMARTNGLVEIGKLKLKDIQVLEPPLITTDLYHYLHKKHEHLLPKITQALQDMKAEGRPKEIWKQTIAEAISQ